MDFYNFEKYNDVFCFKKLANDYQPLLKTYTDNYQTSMNTFLKEYEENTELRFIESQLYFCHEEINIQKSIITSLKKLDHETFYYVRNRISEKYFVYLKKIGFQDDELDTDLKNKNSNNDEPNELKAPTIINCTNDEDEDDEDVLNMHATAENFIKFISNRITSLCLINEFLELRKQEVERALNKTLPTVPATENKHPNMFINDSFKLFEYILNTHITENRGRINDISFYYWKMYNDNYIIQKPYPFVEWYTKIYDVESFQIKTLNTTQNPNRLKHYSNSLEWFKLKNQ